MESVEMPSLPAGYSYDYDEYGGANPRGSSLDLNPPHRDPYRMASSPTQESSYYRHANSGHDAYTRHEKKDDSPIDHLKRGAEALLPPKYAQKLREVSMEREQKKEVKKEKLESDLAYGSTTSLTSPKPSASESVPPGLYAKPQQWEYDRPDEKLSYSSASYRSDSYGPDPRSSGANVVSADPSSGRGSRRGRSPLPPAHARVSSLAVNTGNHSASSSLSVNTGRTTAQHSASSSLAVNASSVGYHTPSHSLSSAPPSPLQEAYHGTYQSISPMPSPLLLPSNGHSSTDLLEPLSPGLSDGEFGEKKRRRARFHDPVDDAARLAQALKGDRHPPDTEPLIEILPGMTHEQLMELRAEYKRLVKAGPEHKGVNVAKHIRARLKDEDPSLMKACYATALGRWESEAYWANFWYQGDKTRRELLIESLMGRTNAEVGRIKDAFSDKKYADSLTRCMKTELKEDKFKRAVLLVLEERRMEERDEHGRPVPVDFDLVRDDVEALYRAVIAEKGGESAMIQIVVLRSDSHLREVLRLYEKSFSSNFARDMLKKSGNLVGEVLAHILNGVINKPVRDALLLNHALRESSSGSSRDRDSLRRELLTSRLVRYHWDRHHMAAVKRAYRDRYGQELAEAVREGTSGQWGLFCQQLVVTRMPDDVKKFESVEIIRDVRKEDREREREREQERLQKGAAILTVSQAILTVASHIR
ncbi:putative annexin anxc4 protein [Eutypa lata UCREL1]|uniref:Putative annexin anxc4 protein n=1 Tax=Eutypa lata (strain UCR-EL1) TaxID=1287681 RepID=M7SMD5_EUTLA|nr:putative annexin anxc4 protein [Eutypa lata UCREL1]